MDIFIAKPNGTFVCPHCIPASGLDPEAVDTEVWPVGSSGWIAPIECCMCGKSIDVEVMPRISIDEIGDGFVCHDEHCGLRSEYSRNPIQGGTLVCEHCGRQHYVT